MSTYQTEEEQVEAIKNWWKENGKSVIGGAVLGLALVGGYKGWDEYTRVQAETASAYYEGFSQLATRGDSEAAIARGEKIVSEYPASAYAAFTALELAKLHYHTGDSAEARENLNWVINNADEDGIKQLAQLRLARLLMDDGDLAAAEQLVDTVDAGKFSAAFEEIRGDIASSRGDMETARKAYAEALTQGINNQSLVQMKLTEAGG